MILTSCMVDSKESDISTDSVVNLDKQYKISFIHYALLMCQSLTHSGCEFHRHPTQKDHPVQYLTLSVEVLSVYSTKYRHSINNKHGA